MMNGLSSFPNIYNVNIKNLQIFTLNKNLIYSKNLKILFQKNNYDILKAEFLKNNCLSAL